MFVQNRKLTDNYRNFTFKRAYFIVVLLQHNKLVERQQQHSIVVIQQQQREWVWETRPTLYFNNYITTTPAQKSQNLI
jgi:hypothetical protein